MDFAPEGIPARRVRVQHRDGQAFGLALGALVEGVCDVFRAAEAGIPAVACLGNDLTGAQAVKLGLLRQNVVVAFDNDDAGRLGATRAMVALRPHCWARRVRAVEIPEGYKDVAEMPAEAVAEWFRSVQV
jgi:DNA primase